MFLHFLTEKQITQKQNWSVPHLMRINTGYIHLLCMQKRLCSSAVQTNYALSKRSAVFQITLSRISDSVSFIIVHVF